jgi:hypothetical protein
VTKLRWDDPPKEPDPARVAIEQDEAVKFSGRRDGRIPLTRERLLIRDRLVILSDMIRSYEELLWQIRTPLDELGETLCRVYNLESEEPVDRRETEHSYRSTIAELKIERANLELRLARLPRNDRF